MLREEQDEEIALSGIVNTTVALADIVPHPRNYRAHPDEQLSDLGASHSRFGQYRSVVLWQRPGGKYMQVAGHGIVEAMRLNDVTEVRADILPENTPQSTIDAIMVADNNLALKASDDESLLATLLSEQMNAGYDLATLGSDDETLRQMLEATSQASSDEWSEALGNLPDGEKPPFQQMTFTLSNEQADLIKEALDQALEDKDNFEDMGNQNSNGNALTYVVKFYLEMGKVPA